MNGIFALPASLRITVFVFRMAALGFLFYSISHAALSKSKRPALVYLLSLALLTFVMILTRTPLVKWINPVAGDILNLVVAFPFVISVYRFVKSRRLILLFDALWCLLNVTYLAAIPYFAYVIEASYAYLWVRTIYMHFRTLDETRRERGVLAIKDALDGLDDGVLFHTFGQITYVNGAMKSILASFGLSSYDSTEYILSTIAEKGRRISERIYILSDETRHYRFYIGEEQVSASDVTALENLVLEEEKTRASLNERNKLLREQLDGLIEYQNEKELLNLKSHIHDNLAQRLSILHMFLVNENVDDIAKIRDILTAVEITPGDDPSTLDDLQETFGSIGVHIHVRGTMPADRDRYSLYYDAIKECTTNAIKHGFAKDVYATIADDRLIISNDIPSPGEVRFGNGLSGLSAKAERLGGRLSVSTAEGFAVEIAFASA